MRPIITTLIILLGSINLGFCQIDSLLLDLEYTYFKSDNDTVKNQILLEKVDLYLQQAEISDQILVEIKRVNPQLLSEEKRANFYWNACFANYLKGEPYRAVHYIDAYEKTTHAKDVPFELLKFLVYAEYDTIVSKEILGRLRNIDSSFNCLACLDDIHNYTLKHKNLRMIASYFVPGIGMASVGKPVKGIVSLSLNTLSVLAVTYMIQQQLWFNAIIWGVNLSGKFYTGNIRLTTKLIDQKEVAEKMKLAQMCEFQILQLLEKNALSFRLIQ